MRVLVSLLWKLTNINLIHDELEYTWGKNVAYVSKASKTHVKMEIDQDQDDFEYDSDDSDKEVNIPLSVDK